VQVSNDASGVSITLSMSISGRELREVVSAEFHGKYRSEYNKEKRQTDTNHTRTHTDYAVQSETSSFFYTSEELR